jgi:hypothetical protein
MPGRTEVIRDVPTDQKARLEDDFRAAGATVAWTDQGGGKWTLTATFPPAGGASPAAKKKPGGTD